MRREAIRTPFQSIAPRFLGALFCSLVLFTGSSCRKDDKPSDGAVSVPPAKALVGTVETPAEVSPPGIPPATATATSGLRFITYNVRNWLTEDRISGKETIKGKPKPEIQRKTAIALLSRHAPDVVGLCEIGSAVDLAEIQESLKAQGVHLPYSHFTGGTDPVRHLGLLSRFPIVSTAKPTETEFSHGGQSYGINRGILDATIEARGKSYRFVGVHLKSKRDTEQGDQAAIRLNEARLLRRHIDSILKVDPQARLVVYGDLNDSRSSPVVKAVLGKNQSPGHLMAVLAKDSSGNTWTHRWVLHDIYSRIDYVIVSRSLRKDVVVKAARVIDDADWANASDHRPVLTVFR